MRITSNNPLVRNCLPSDLPTLTFITAISRHPAIKVKRALHFGFFEKKKFVFCPNWSAQLGFFHLHLHFRQKKIYVQIRHNLGSQLEIQVLPEGCCIASLGRGKFDLQRWFFSCLQNHLCYQILKIKIIYRSGGSTIETFVKRP